MLLQDILCFNSDDGDIHILLNDETQTVTILNATHPNVSYNLKYNTETFVNIIPKANYIYAYESWILPVIIESEQFIERCRNNNIDYNLILNKFYDVA